MAKRILLVTVGSLGDLHPFIAYGVALKAAGYGPVIAATEAYRGKVQAAGPAFHPVRPTIEQLMADTGLDEAGSAEDDGIQRQFTSQAPDHSLS
jgi:rhamnosyltransferase subunit B